MHSTFGPSGQFPTVLSGLYVLLVEDDPDGRELFTYTLEKRGASVTPVDSASAALSALDHVWFNVLVSDIGLPDEDGYALIAKVRRRTRGYGGKTPAVAVTAFPDAESRTRALAAGFQAFVPKPTELDELACVIAMVAHRVAESRRLLDDLRARADVQGSVLARLDALVTDRERVLAESRRLRDDGRRLRGREGG